MNDSRYQRPRDSRRQIRGLFLLAALYNRGVGALFLFAPLYLFEQNGVTPPNHPAYVQLPALYMLLFAIAFLHVAWRPRRARLLIPYGAASKLLFAALVLAYLFAGGVPSMWLPMAFIDFSFSVLMLAAWRELDQSSKSVPSS